MSQPDWPAAKYAPVTPDDVNPLPGGDCRCLLVGTGGTANLVQPDGTLRTNVPLQTGYNPLIVKQVKTGGTATGIWALY